MTVTIRAAIEAGELSARQRTLVADVLLAAEVLAELEATEYRRQDQALVVLRETWRRLVASMPGATTILGAQDG